MSGALTGPFLVAAAVLCVAGAAKLARPQPAARALAVGRLPAGARLVRAFAAGEVSLGVWSLAAPSVPASLALCVAFACFTVLSAVLAQRGSSCGCFGAGESPATRLQSLLSALLALVAAAGAVWPPHGVGWLLGRSPGVVIALAIGLTGAVYATVLAYTELPAAWATWERG